jgi:Protein of unknown function (DUF2721)
MPQDPAVTAVAHVIQLAVAPVFLLTSIGAVLAVLTNRLSRVVDRARALEALLPDAGPADQPGVRAELAALSRRAALVGRAITLCTLTALLVCSVIAILFLGASLGFNASATVSFLFVAAMLTFFSGLLCFLREVLIATAGLRIGPR